MRKHFLLLFLMALLPLVGWAADATLRIEPTRISGLRYTGQPQALIAEITDQNYQPDYKINYGGVLFKVTDYSATAEQLAAFTDHDEGVTEETPTGQDAGMYYVYYRVKGDGVYNEGAWTALGGVYINKAIIETTDVTAPEGKTGLVYDKTSQALLENPAQCSVSTGAITYKIGTSDWKESIDDEVFVGTNAGDYVISWKVAETQNYEAYEGEVTVNIATASIGAGTTTAATGYTVTFADAADATKTFTGSAITYTTANFTVNGPLDEAVTFSVEPVNNTNVPAADAADADKPHVVVTGTGNYGGSVIVPFTINPKNIATGLTIADLADVTYTGAAITAPEDFTTGKVKFGTITMLEGEDKDYTISVDQAKFTVATGGTITIQGHGNYSGSTTKDFNVAKATLQVTPKAGQNKNIGTTDPATYHFTTVEDHGLLGQDAPAANQTIEQKVNSLITNAAQGGAISVTRAAGEDAGTFALNVALSAAPAPVFANYNIEAVNDPEVLFTINRAGVTITATPAEQTFGYTVPDITNNKNAFDFTAFGLVGGESITDLSFDVVKKGTETLLEEDARLVVATYVVTPKAATATSDSYEFNYVPGEFQVVKKVIKVVAIDKETNYSKNKADIEDIDLAKDEDGSGEPVVYSTWKDTKVKLCNDDEELTAFDPTAYDGIFEGTNNYINWKKYLINSLTWDKDAATISNPGEIVIGLKEYDTANFTVTPVNGKVTWNNVPEALELSDNDNDVFEKIQEYDGATVNVKITFNRDQKLKSTDETARTWEKEKWTSIVLPFAIDIAELSSKFGYAIFNVADPAATEAGKVAFKLEMAAKYDDNIIPANTPLLIKTNKNIENATLVNFGSKKIEAPAAAQFGDAINETGYKFMGTYEAMTVNATSDYADNFYFWTGTTDKPSRIQSSSTKGNTWVIKPFSAYVDQRGSVTSPEMELEFTYEELNGSTTAVRGISVDEVNNESVNKGIYNLNGLKMNSIPTQKGVYILNGKKVVIK